MNLRGNKKTSVGDERSGHVSPSQILSFTNDYHIQTVQQQGGGFKDFLFSPLKLGKIPNLTNIFEMG